MKKFIKFGFIISLVITGIIATTGAASAAAPEKVEAFVCPVINSAQMGMHNPNAVPLGDTGTYTVGQPTAHHKYVPAQATNMDGAGIPGGPQAAPGDTDYTAIWAVQP